MECSLKAKYGNACLFFFFYAYTCWSVRCFFKNNNGDLPEVCYIPEYWKIAWTFAWKQIGRRHKGYFGNRRAQSSRNGKVEKQDATGFGRVDMKKESSSECMLSVPKIVNMFTALIALKLEVTLHWSCFLEVLCKTIFIFLFWVFFLIRRNTMLIMICLQNKELIHWHILHYLKRNCFLLW